MSRNGERVAYQLQRARDPQAVGFMRCQWGHKSVFVTVVEVIRQGDERFPTCLATLVLLIGAVSPDARAASSCKSIVPHACVGTAVTVTQITRTG